MFWYKEEKQGSTLYSGTLLKPSCFTLMIIQWEVTIERSVYLFHLTTGEDPDDTAESFYSWFTFILAFTLSLCYYRNKVMTCATSKYICSRNSWPKSATGRVIIEENKKRSGNNSCFLLMCFPLCDAFRCLFIYRWFMLSKKDRWTFNETQDVMWKFVKCHSFNTYINECSPLIAFRTFSSNKKPRPIST